MGIISLMKGNARNVWNFKRIFLALLINFLFLRAKIFGENPCGIQGKLLICCESRKCDWSLLFRASDVRWSKEPFGKLGKTFQLSTKLIQSMRVKSLIYFILLLNNSQVFRLLRFKRRRTLQLRSFLRSFPCFLWRNSSTKKSNLKLQITNRARGTSHISHSPTKRETRKKVRFALGDQPQSSAYAASSSSKLSLTSGTHGKCPSFLLWNTTRREREVTRFFFRLSKYKFIKF